jgi:hypothetical protein
MPDTSTRQRHRGRPQTHGVTALRRAVEGLGNRVVSRRYKVGRALHKWRMELLDDLGGIEAVSTQELALAGRGIRPER